MRTIFTTFRKIPVRVGIKRQYESYRDNELEKLFCLEVTRKVKKSKDRWLKLKPSQYKIDDFSPVSLKVIPRNSITKQQIILEGHVRVEAQPSDKFLELEDTFDTDLF
eukprot:UN28612